MDKNNEIPKDMVEQMLKYVPSQEETVLLEEHSQKIDEMARADRFFFEMSRIVHYEQRLKALFYKKSFSERINVTKPKVQAVHDASRQLSSSGRLKKTLEIILAFGNYMNKGQRGNAYGFKIASLNKIIDTKSSQDKNVTLLHYLVETCEKSFPDLLKLPDDLHSVKDASKASMTELDGEVGVLREGIKDVEKELAFHRARASAGDADPRDKFVTVVAEFLTVASFKFSDLEGSVVDMKKEYSTTTKMFGEDPAKMQPEEFFAVFDAFVVAFVEAKIDNETIRRKKAEEEKRMKQLELLEKERANRAKSKRGQKGEDGGVEDAGKKPGEFDDLISALRTGEVFGDDMSKLKRNRKRAGGLNNGTVMNGGAKPDDLLGAGVSLLTSSSASPKSTPSKKRSGSRDRLAN